MNGKDIQLMLNIEKECDSINLEFLKTVGIVGFGDKLFECSLPPYPYRSEWVGDKPCCQS